MSNKITTSNQTPLQALEDIKCATIPVEDVDVLLEETKEYKIIKKALNCIKPTVSNTVNILGVEYKIIFTGLPNWKYAPKDGRCDYRAKKLEILLDGSVMYIATVLRHEIIHAFFFESGLEQYAHDETLIQVLAMQLDKINKIVFEGHKLLEKECK